MAPFDDIVIQGCDTSEPFLVMAGPAFAKYRLTLARAEDATAIYSILSRAEVGGYLSNAPEPYTMAHAQSWLAMQPSDNEYRMLSLNRKSSQDRQTILEARFPFNYIRDTETGNVVGSFSIRRNSWEWMAICDPERRKALLAENEARDAGDPEIQYSIGYYLAPDVSSRGLMTAVVALGLSYAKQYMNSHQVQGICRVDNIPSKRVLEKNDFVYAEQVEMPWKGKTAEVLIFNKLLE